MSIRTTRLVLVGALLLTGSGSGVAQAAMVDTATVPTSARMLTLTKARTIAAAGVLRASDMPGYTRKRNLFDAETRASDAWMAGCVGRKMGPYLTRNPGYTHAKGNTQIISSTEVAKTLTAARADKATLMSSRYRSCLLQQLTTEFAAADIEITSSKFTVVAPKIYGADTTYGYILDLKLRLSGVDISLQMLLISSNVRHAEVRLIVTTMTSPVSKTNAYRLLGIAVKRVKRASA